MYVTDREEKSGHQTVSRIHAEGGKGEFLSLDVSTEESCEQLRTKIDSESRAVDILVNNAGIGHVGTMLQTSGADLDRLYAVNVRGVFNVSKAFLPEMLSRKRGVITLAEDLDTSQVGATYRDGVLHISVKRSEAAKPRRININ